MTAVLPPSLAGNVQATAASPAGDCLVYATADALACADGAGAERWRYEFAPAGAGPGMARADCTFSRDGAVVWFYRPDVYAERGDDDRWIALDAATGTVLGEAALPTYGGHGASHLLHPDGFHVLLEVGCGQDGAFVFLGWIDEQGRMDWSAWPGPDSPSFGDQWVADISVDGRTVMAVSHDCHRVDFLDFPSGTVQWTLTRADLGIDLEADQLETAFVRSGTIRDDQVAIVRIIGETSDLAEGTPTWAAAGLGPFEEYAAYRVLDLRRRRVLGPADASGTWGDRQPPYLPLHK